MCNIFLEFEYNVEMQVLKYSIKNKTVVKKELLKKNSIQKIEFYLQKKE